MEARSLREGVLLDQDTSVPMRDGTRLAASVFRPPGVEKAPVLLSVTPYGKDVMPDRIGMTLMRLAGVRFGKLRCSRLTGFEAPDPMFWTACGYVVVQADVRGMHRSEGHAGVLTQQDAEDYFDLIEWVARQPWSSGSVGLLGVSYLAMSQWRVAALRPPSLRAIVPWEGVTDLLREFGYQDGVPETGFVRVWWLFRMRRGRNRRFAMAEDFQQDRDRHPLDDAYWASKRPALEAIDVPALVCASWSDQGLHTRGSLEGFRRIGSARKWLYTHGRRKWETFYSEEARDVQRRFLDCHVKGEVNDWEATPRVRLEVRRTRDEFTVRDEADWPLPSVRYVPMFLDARTNRLVETAPAEPGQLDYRALGSRRRDRARFIHRFDVDTELTGSMMLRLWVSASEGDDLDLFALLRKFDSAGREVFFYGYNGFAKDGVAKGWLRASHRMLDPSLSEPGRPWHTHTRHEPVAAGEIVAVEVEILASSTLFEAGSSLSLDVLGQDAARYPAFRHKRSVNHGRHTIYTGGPHASHLLLPIVGGPS
jgi:predicted acyl esterase